jgi:hypothetical protein
MDASKSRLLRFGLRTMFVALTVCALIAWGGAWLADNAGLVKQRREALSTFSSLPGDSQSGIPWVRRAMGDKAIAHILLGTWATEDEFQRAVQLFPEAKVRRNDPWWERLIEWGPRGI